MSLANQLIHLRNVKGISQEELASLMDVTRQSVSKWETSQSYPDADKVIRLSEIFGVTTDYLLKGVENDPMDIYSQHNSKAGADMSAEVHEHLNHIHNMSSKERTFKGIGILLAFLLVLIIIIWTICKTTGLIP